MTHRNSFLIVSLVALAACTGPIESQRLASSQQGIIDGTPDAIGVLAFLNASTTTFPMLDDDVALDRRAAANLMGYRAGADDLLGTGDDKSFQTIDQVDDVKWVGPSALNKLVAYAKAGGYVPEGEDVLGVYDNVAFTVNEANATLHFANFEPHHVLDHDIALDRRAADSILAARPIATVLQLSQAYFVGYSAMLKLREAPKPSGAADGETCKEHGDCLSGLCVGLTMPFDAWCAPEWMANEFTHDEVVDIPDGDPNGLVLKADFSGLGTVPVDVILYLEVDHPHPEDLLVELYQPGGGYEVIWDHQADTPFMNLAGPGIERDNMANGVWTIKITDTVPGNAGEFGGSMLWLSTNMD